MCILFGKNFFDFTSFNVSTFRVSDLPQLEGGGVGVGRRDAESDEVS